jgi:hypothetical protein
MVTKNVSVSLLTSEALTPDIYACVTINFQFGSFFNLNGAC